MSKLIICRGIPASSKTFWAKQWVLEDPEHRVRFNNDDIRNMLGKYWVPSREPMVAAMKDSFVEEAILLRLDMVVDNTNLNNKEIEYWKTGLICIIMTLNLRISLILLYRYVLNVIKLETYKSLKK